MSDVGLLGCSLAFLILESLLDMLYHDRPDRRCCLATHMVCLHPRPDGCNGTALLPRMPDHVHDRFPWETTKVKVHAQGPVGVGRGEDHYHHEGA
jgi:hypothetical protein